MGGLQNVEYYEQTEYTFEARAANDAIPYLYWTRDLASYAVLISSGSSATITGGTFAEGRYGTIEARDDSPTTSIAFPYSQRISFDNSQWTMEN